MPRQVRRIKPLVLIVDDHEDTRFLLRTLLEMRGLSVLEAEDGARAVDMVESQRPDLVLMDAGLPLLDGLAATRWIRTLDALVGMPIVFLSGHVHPSFRAAALAAGADDFLIKPFDLRQLETIIERHLGKNTA